VNENDVRLRDYLEAIILERDRRYEQRFIDAKLLTDASFASSEKAIVKAEEAQREYNVRSNEFRGQLDDQAKLLMPRTEVTALMKAIEDKMESARRDNEKAFDSIREDIKGLTGSGKELSGKLWLPMIVVAALAAAVGAAAAKFIVR